jgi:hypothetical protein
MASAEAQLVTQCLRRSTISNEQVISEEPLDAVNIVSQARREAAQDCASRLVRDMCSLYIVNVNTPAGYSKRRAV